MTLVEFLNARIAEDEAVAQAASPGPWTVNNERYVESIGCAAPWSVVDGARWGGEASIFNENDDAFHIVRFDPSRMLAECASKRALVDWVTSVQGYPAAGDPAAFRADEAAALTTILHILAAPYSDHPDYAAAVGGV